MPESRDIYEQWQIPAILQNESCLDKFLCRYEIYACTIFESSKHNAIFYLIFDPLILYSFVSFRNMHNNIPQRPPAPAQACRKFSIF